MTFILFFPLVVHLFSTSAAIDSAKFSKSQGDISAYLCAATYCETSNYTTHIYTGPTEGFIATKLVQDRWTTATGYVGYLPSDRSIYVVFRGSSTARNWISDFEVSKIDYPIYPECNCQVAKGFFNAEQSIVEDVVREVRRLSLHFPTYSVKLTGHRFLIIYEFVIIIE